MMYDVRDVYPGEELEKGTLVTWGLEDVAHPIVDIYGGEVAVLDAREGVRLPEGTPFESAGTISVLLSDITRVVTPCWNAEDKDFDDDQLQAKIAEALAEVPTYSDDIVRQPQHYAKWAIEPITFIMKNGLRFEVGNIVKYAVRAGSKLYEGMDEVQSEITDLKKVQRYAEMRINQLEGKEVL